MAHDDKHKDDVQRGDRVKVFDAHGDTSVDVRDEQFPDMTDAEVRKAVAKDNRKDPHIRWYVR